mmetsp:Transcript_34630/g.52212  ORF Transcript_34630/g.52212 Transcript_34630/m.52212 type:complete len:84 (+) Transcript_34630:394-645(+)
MHVQKQLQVGKFATHTQPPPTRSKLTALSGGVSCRQHGLNEAEEGVGVDAPLHLCHAPPVLLSRLDDVENGPGSPQNEKFVGR